MVFMSYTDPLLGSHVTDLQRDRAVDYLQQAYATGALSPEDFETRLGIALTATTRDELNSSLRGLARIAPNLKPLSAAPPARVPVPDNVANVGAGFTHLSGLFTNFIGPAVVKAASTPGSLTWLEASRALAFQLTGLIAFVAALGAAIIFHTGTPMFLGWLAWLVGTILLSVRAFNGQDSTARIERFLPVKPEKARTPISRW